MNFPQAFLRKNKDFTAILKSHIFCEKMKKNVVTFFIRQNLGGALMKMAIKNEPIIVETSTTA